MPPGPSSWHDLSAVCQGLAQEFPSFLGLNRHCRLLICSRDSCSCDCPRHGVSWPKRKLVSFPWLTYRVVGMATSLETTGIFPNRVDPCCFLALQSQCRCLCLLSSFFPGWNKLQQAPYRGQFLERNFKVHACIAHKASRCLSFRRVIWMKLWTP